MYTDSNTTRAIIQCEENEPIVKGFPTTNPLAIGTIVKLKTDGSIEPVAAYTDRPLGLVVSGWQGNDAGNARVLTHFSAVVKAKADGAITTSNELAAGAFVGAEGLNDYKVAVATNWVSAIALSDAADNGEVWVGILRVPYLKA